MALIPEGTGSEETHWNQNFMKQKIRIQRKTYRNLRLKRNLRKLTDNFVVIPNLQIVNFVTCTNLV